MILDPTVLSLTIALMLLMVMLLVGVIHSRLHWIIKAIMIMLSLAVAGMSYATYVNKLGWAVVDEPPELFQVLGSVVREPNQSDPGAIYVWYKVPGTKEPRAIILPYTKEMHKKMNKAKGMMERGQQVFMKGKKGAKPKVLGDSDNAESQTIMDFVPPPRTIPDKDPQNSG